VTNETTVSAKDACSAITMNVRVTGVRGMMLRVRLGVMLIRIGVWIIGCRCTVSDERGDA